MQLTEERKSPRLAGGFLLTPQIALRHAYVHANGFGESGANAPRV